MAEDLIYLSILGIETSIVGIFISSIFGISVFTSGTSTFIRGIFIFSYYNISSWVIFSDFNL